MDEYLLSKKDFTTSMKKAYKNLLNDTDFTDVTLACANNKWAKAHKVILSGNSTFFKNIFIKNPHKNPLVYLKGVKIEDLEAVLEFIYLGETKVGKTNVNSFLETAKELEVEGLTEDKGDDSTDGEQLKTGDNQEETSSILDSPNLSIDDSSYTIDQEVTDDKTTVGTLPDSYSGACQLCGFVTKAKTKYNKDMVIKRHVERVHNRDNSVEDVKIEANTSSQISQADIDVITVTDTAEEFYQKYIKDVDNSKDDKKFQADNQNESVAAINISENMMVVIEEEQTDTLQETVTPQDSASYGCKFCGFVTVAQTKHNRKMVMKRHTEKVHSGI